MITLPSINKKDVVNHLYGILHHGRFVNQIETQIMNDDTESSCLVSENFQYNEYQDDTFWKNVMSDYQNDMFVFAIALGRTDPIVTLRVSTKTFIDSKKLKKLCFVFHRNDNGRKYEPMIRETVINIRDDNGDIAARSVLTGLHGYNMRGKIEIPNDLDLFRVEFKTSFNCKNIPNDFIPSCITAISDMWLEERQNQWMVIKNLHDSSDPEPDSSSPNPDEPDENEYAHAVTPEVPHGLPYEKIWFNEDGLIYRGSHVYASEIDTSTTDTTSIKDRLSQIENKLPENMTPNKLIVTNDISHIEVFDKLTPEDLSYMTLFDDESVPVDPL